LRILPKDGNSIQKRSNMKKFLIGEFLQPFHQIDFGKLADFLLWVNKNANGHVKIEDGYSAITFNRDEDALMFFLTFSDTLKLKEFVD
jgi:hypothetical protein